MDFEKSYREICTKAGDDLFRRGVELYGKLTEDERKMLRAGSAGFRSARIILCAVADTVEPEWAAESILQDIKRVKRIRKNRA